MSDCLFCKIINKEIPSEVVYEDDDLLAFNDIDPKAPTHVLIIPKKHITTMNDLTEKDNALIGQMFQAAKHIAKEKGLAEDGYRVVMNCNKKGGQAVYHIHLHLLGGRQMTWPPG
jgi:histidine triad (HIT) family protein